MFVAQFSNSATLVGDSYVGLNAANTQTLYGSAASTLSSACTFNALYVTGTLTAGIGQTMTLTLIKNGAVTGLTTSISPSTNGVTVASNDTIHSFSVVAGDTVAIRVNQASTAPTIRMSVTTQCQ